MASFKDIEISETFEGKSTLQINFTYTFEYDISDGEVNLNSVSTDSIAYDKLEALIPDEMQDIDQQAYDRMGEYIEDVKNNGYEE